MGLLWLLIKELVNTLKVVVSRCELEMGRRFFHVRVIQRWNSLFESAVMQPTLSTFKQELDKELFNLLYSVLLEFFLFSIFLLLCLFDSF